jgi:hypothetical protein
MEISSADYFLLTPILMSLSFAVADFFGEMLIKPSSLESFSSIDLGTGGFYFTD